MEAKHRKLICLITILYTIAVLYFMFLGFNRPGAAKHTVGYTFYFIPDVVFKYPTGFIFRSFTLMDLVGIGNLAAFVPFGIFIPLLFRIRFTVFISLFFMSILVLETLQAITLLGSFDMNDAFQNTIGAAAGFAAYKIGFRSANFWRNGLVTILSGIFLVLVILGLSQLIDKAFFTKAEGPVLALTEKKEQNGHLPMEHLKSMEIGGKRITPQFNFYSSDGKQTETYQYSFSNHTTIIEGYCGIPDGADAAKAGVVFTTEGFEENYTEFCRPADGEQQEPYSFYVHLDKVKKLTITLEGSQMLWDVTFKEMKYKWAP
ncbi:VanZ family protein [Paenibacillus radicis (ex Gao et al. 2016)]|uniref:VanZ-like domain-containing protein n=1 Tax=Paenibacillus radicis (ex Gao et al. 2016) TaxID=1737354 RepID=A0A917GVP0_9BACL|nr:VanZ family protein [Paenibacillus radicis (ex Gao et al. 2016)]GGG58326.1 hypothetical protein GCM10010918_09250 [Paenibacillus radicis (ex Gao et al. 2016)]